MDARRLADQAKPDAQRLARLDLAAAERADLADARAASDAKSLGERTAEAIAWLAVSVAEIARVSKDEADFARRLEGDPPIAPSDCLPARAGRR